MILDATKDNWSSTVQMQKWIVWVLCTTTVGLAGGSIGAASMYFAHENRLSSAEIAVQVLTERSQRTNELLEQVVQLLMKRD